MIDSLRNTYLPSLSPSPVAFFLHEYVVVDVHVHLYERTKNVQVCMYTYGVYTRVYTGIGSMYGFVARTSNCARDHRERVDVYDKCEIPFRDDYVLLSFGWVMTDPPPPFSFSYITLSEGKKSYGIVGLRHLAAPTTTTMHLDDDRQTP